jgi:FAD synthetase
MKKVLVFGTFDVLHAGHLNFFQQAAALGDELYAVIARDETVAQVKGRRARQGELERLSAVKKVNFIKDALLGNADDKYRVIEQIRPDIIALGYDQESFVDRLEQELASRALVCRIVRLKPFQPEKYKSSLVAAL